LYSYNASLGGHTLLVDSREFDGTGVSYSSVTSLQLLDIYNGPVEFKQGTAGSWITYFIPGNISSNITNSTNQSKIRLQDSWYGVRAEYTFTQTQNYKQHGIDLSYTNQTDLNTLYSSVVGVSDVYIAFKELSNGGIFGNQSGLEFTNGIQFMNADVDGNGVFNESDTNYYNI
jgi:hypothetical protein